MKKIVSMLILVLLSVTLTACSGGKVEWKDSFYMYLEEDHAIVITFKKNAVEPGDSMDVTLTEVWTGAGISIVDETTKVELTKKNTAEDRGYEYVLKKDKLEVTRVSKGKAATVNGNFLEGTYTRGEAIDETFDTDDDPVLYYKGILLTEFYYEDGEYGNFSMYFYSDGTVDIDLEDGTTEVFEYVIEDDEITLSNGYYDDIILTIVDYTTLHEPDSDIEMMLED